MGDVIPGALASHELCQLVWSYEPTAHPRRAVWQPKLDGIRCLWIGGRMVSREGSPMECAEHARAELEDLQQAFGQAMMFDAELVVSGSLGATLSAFRSRRPAGLLYVFDAVPLDQWTRAGQTTPLDQRLTELDRHQLDYGGTIARRVPWGLCELQNVCHLFEDIRARGGEGIVVKDAASPYYRGRSRSWMKVKRAPVMQAIA